jgi:hypothetical protein
MLVITGLRELVLVVRVRLRRSRREVRAEMQWRRVQVGGRRGQWDLRAQGVEMSENWEEWAGMAVLELGRRGVRRVFGGGADGFGPGDGGSGCLVAFALALVNGGYWTCWRAVVAGGHGRDRSAIEVLKRIL